MTSPVTAISAAGAAPPRRTRCVWSPAELAQLAAPVQRTDGVPALTVRAGGMTFEFAAGTDPAWLARVLRAVQAGA